MEILLVLNPVPSVVKPITLKICSELNSASYSLLFGTNAPFIN